jgi:cob(I)alamin adenosyltransferase
MFYTRKGDAGQTKIASTPPGEKISKASPVIEVLGTLDELNSLLGLSRSLDDKAYFSLKPAMNDLRELIFDIQEDLFIIQAELAGTDLKFNPKKVSKIEEITDFIEKSLPPIKSFLVPGGDFLSSLFDFARTISRRAERRVVEAVESGTSLKTESLAYLNRLSSLFYALARMANHIKGKRERVPRYI